MKIALSINGIGKKSIDAENLIKMKTEGIDAVESLNYVITVLFKDCAHQLSLIGIVLNYHYIEHFCLQ